MKKKQTMEIPAGTPKKKKKGLWIALGAVVAVAAIGSLSPDTDEPADPADLDSSDSAIVTEAPGTDSGEATEAFEIDEWRRKETEATTSPAEAEPKTTEAPQTEAEKVSEATVPPAAETAAPETAAEKVTTKAAEAEKVTTKATTAEKAKTEASTEEESEDIDEDIENIEEPERNTDPPFSDYEHEQSEGTTYVLNTNTMKFHYPDCRSVKKIASENYEEMFGTRDDAIARGFDPCGICEP